MAGGTIFLGRIYGCGGSDARLYWVGYTVVVGARTIVLEWERSRFILCEFGRFMVDQCHEIFTLKFADVFAVVNGRGRGRDSGGRAVVVVDAKMHPQIETYLKYTTYAFYL